MRARSRNDGKVIQDDVLAARMGTRRRVFCAGYTATLTVTMRYGARGVSSTGTIRYVALSYMVVLAIELPDTCCTKGGYQR